MEQQMLQTIKKDKLILKILILIIKIQNIQFCLEQLNRFCLSHLKKSNTIYIMFLNIFYLKAIQILFIRYF